MAVTLNGSQWYRRTAFWAANQPVTAMAWIFPTTLPPTGESNYTNIVNQEGAQGLSLFHNGTNVRVNVGTMASDFPGTTVVSANTWYHVAWTRSVNAHLLYVNGVPEASGSDAQVVGTVLSIADFDNGAIDNEWIGRLAAVKCWSAALTAAEVANEMRCYLPIRTTNLLGFYPLFSTGDDEIDYSGGGNTLTVTGTPATGDGPPIPWRVGMRRRWYSLGAAPPPEGQPATKRMGGVPGGHQLAPAGGGRIW